jgi:hypothetical protein
VRQPPANGRLRNYDVGSHYQVTTREDRADCEDLLRVSGELQCVCE